MLSFLAKRWKQYKYRFVPWIALNLRKRRVRTVKDERNDKVIPDSKVEQSLKLFFTGLATQENGFNDEMHNPRVQRTKGQEVNGIGSNRHFQSVEVLNQCDLCHYSCHQCDLCHYSCQYPNKNECQKMLTTTQDNFNIKYSFLYLVQQLIKITHVDVLQLKQFFGFQFGQKVKGPDLAGKTLSNNLCNLQSRVTESLAIKPTAKMVCTFYGTTSSSRSVTNATSPNQRNNALHGTRLRCHKGLEVMQRMLGFTIGRRPSSIAEGGTGVFVTRGTIPADTIVALYPGTVYKLWEPILLQSIANPFIFRCLDGTLIDGNDKGISRMVYRSCTRRDMMGPYLTSDLSWLTDTLTNPMAVGQYVNNQNKDNEANVVYQEFDVPESLPFHLLQFIPNAFYSSTYQQGDSSKPRLMRTVVLVSLREIQCGEELFSAYFTIVH